VLAAKGFKEDPRRRTWFNLKARKSLSHQAIRDYDEMSWKTPFSSIVPVGEFWFYSSGGLAIQVCEEQLAQWGLDTLRPVIQVPGQFAPNRMIVTNIDDPRYWEPLTDEQVIEKMQGGQAGSPIWNRAEGELRIRELRRASQRRSEVVDQNPAPAVPDANLGCIKSKSLRNIAERDWKECSLALDAGCWKSVLILSGGILEAIVLSKLLRRRSKAVKAKAATGGSPDPNSWTLGKMIAVAKELDLFGPAIDMLPAPMKDYRNLAHPGYEVRKKLSISEKSARASFHVLTLILEELERSLKK
jgi:hypothetical protein